MPPRGGSRDAVSVVNVFAHRGEFFRVLQETQRSQTAVMTVAPAADAGPPEVHDADQIVYVVEGEAIVALVMIPAGTRHHVRNPGPTPLFFVTVYAPPEY